MARRPLAPRALVYGHGSVQVTAKLRSMLQDLAEATSLERREAVRRKLVQRAHAHDVLLPGRAGST